MKHATEYRDKALSQGLIREINKRLTRDIRIMEVCGTHTVSIFRSGIRSVIPNRLSLISGPGCPVCVTSQGDIDACIALASMENVIITTFGDLMRVPGNGSSLQKERANGRDIRMVYSTVDALNLAKENPDKEIVFLGIGFETTAPTVAASVLAAAQMGIGNFSVYCAHKTVPAALDALMGIEGVDIDGFLLPGHVTVIIGTDAYQAFVDTHRIPGVVGGFEPTDILQGLLALIRQVESGTARIENAYPRVITSGGNTKAQAILAQTFEPCDAVWRGIGVIPKSGLAFRKEYKDFDAGRRFEVKPAETENPRGCICGQILTGLKSPPECTLYKKRCTPLDPVGPCMVSSEGTCAAYYKYYQEDLL
jgi:hydrogenase expression/formation protein HypD